MKLKTEEIVELAADRELPQKLREICREVDEMNRCLTASMHDEFQVKEVTAEIREDGRYVAISGVYAYGFGAFGVAGRYKYGEEDKDKDDDKSGKYKDADEPGGDADHGDDGENDDEGDDYDDDGDYGDRGSYDYDYDYDDDYNDDNDDDDDYDDNDSDDDMDDYEFDEDD